MLQLDIELDRIGPIVADREGRVGRLLLKHAVAFELDLGSEPRLLGRD